MKIQYILELAGTGFFAISGAIVANEKSAKDWFGVTFIAFITAIGGGSVRDILLGSYPLVWIKDINIMYAIIGGVVIASIFYSYLLKFTKTMFLFDTIGVAMFTIIGTEKAIGFGVNPLIAAIMGMFSAVMGGVIRDVLTNETPILFRKELYASVSFAGALFYLMLEYIGAIREVSFIAAVIFILAIRIVAVRYNLTMPHFRKVKA